MEEVSKSLAETEQIAIECLGRLAKVKRQDGGATVVGLVGDLGAGKTTFTQAAALALGIQARVTSPTFVIMKSYQISCQGSPLTQGQGDPFYPWKRLIHIDCYRLDGPKDLLRLGWKEIMADPKNLILIEWPERVGDLIFSPTLKISFEVAAEDSRRVIYSSNNL